MEEHLATMIATAVIAAFGFCAYKTIKGFWRAVDQFALGPKLFCPSARLIFQRLNIIFVIYLVIISKRYRLSNPVWLEVTISSSLCSIAKFSMIS